MELQKVSRRYRIRLLQETDMDDKVIRCFMNIVLRL